MSWEQWVDPWLASLRQAGLSEKQIERRARLLGRVAAGEWRPRRAAEIHTWRAFKAWVFATLKTL